MRAALSVVMLCTFGQVIGQVLALDHEARRQTAESRGGWQQRKIREANIRYQPVYVPFPRTSVPPHRGN